MYSNFFSLFTNIDSASVVTTKTCNYIEFYVRAYGEINLYLDDQLWQNISHPLTGTYNNWRKYDYHCPDGFHIFKWEFIELPSPNPSRPFNANIDNIKFETKQN
jgi:hypothetical protein